MRRSGVRFISPAPIDQGFTAINLGLGSFYLDAGKGGCKWVSDLSIETAELPSWVTWAKNPYVKWFHSVPVEV